MTNPFLPPINNPISNPPFLRFGPHPCPKCKFNFVDIPGDQCHFCKRSSIVIDIMPYPCAKCKLNFVASPGDKCKNCHIQLFAQYLCIQCNQNKVTEKNDICNFCRPFGGGNNPFNIGPFINNN